MRKWRSLTALRACEAVARTGSVSAAAEELRVTRPAISKQIALLEQDLGCALFHRTGNRIEVTPAGDALCRGLFQAFDLISATTESVARAASLGQRVRLLVCRDFASGWLAGQIGAFLVANPGISVEITAEGNGAFRLEEDFDLRIFYGQNGQHPKGALAETELCRWIDLAVCSPGFAGTYLQPGQTAEIPHLIDVHYDVLEDCLRLCGQTLDRGRLRRTLFNESTLPIKVAASGGGLAVGDTFLTLPRIRQGELTVPFKTGLISAQTYSLFTPARDSTKAAARFERWLRTAVEAYQSTVLAELALRGIKVIARA